MSLLIPKVIYQSWKTQTLSAEIDTVVQKTKQLNPNYKYELYDDEKCRDFLFDNFGVNYANSWDTIIPGAFKCDFWRYAILYVNGGIYMDLDMESLVPFDSMLKEDDEFVSIVDRTSNNNVGIFQSFLAVRPKHPIMLNSLQMCFSNITLKTEPAILSVSGPAVIGAALNLFWEKADTNSKINPGNYRDGITLFYPDKNFKYTLDLDKKRIFLNKVDDYDPGEAYGQMEYYKNNTRNNTRCDTRVDSWGNIRKNKFTFWNILVVIIFICLVVEFITSYSYKKSTKK